MTSEVRLMLQQTTCGSRQGKNLRVEKYRRKFLFYERDGGFETSTKQTSARVGLIECFFICSQNNCTHVKVFLCDTQIQGYRKRWTGFETAIT